MDCMCPAVCTELLIHKLCASVALQSEEQCMRTACIIIIAFRPEVVFMASVASDFDPSNAAANGCWDGTMGWRLCLWCSGGRWYCWPRLAVSLCLDLHAGGRLIKPKGEGQY